MKLTPKVKISKYISYITTKLSDWRFIRTVDIIKKHLSSL
jgi:hypothetical protein